MKKLLILLFSLAGLTSYAQVNTFGGIGLRVNDTTTYQTNAAAYHTAGYYDIYFNNQATNDHWDVWNGSAYDHVFDFNSGTGGGSGGSINTLAPNIQTGDYTIQATDTTKIIYMRNASTPHTATIPSGLKVGSTFVIVQDTTATVTIACSGCDLIGTATLTAKEVSVWHHRETGKYVRLGSSGGGSVSDWGDIGGTLSDQTDLQSALDAKQALDSDLTSIAGLSPSNDDIIQRKSGAWTNRTLAQYRTDLALIAASITNGVTTSAPDQDQVFDALALKAPLASPTFTGTVTIPANAYGSGWNGSNKPATEDGVYDKIESLAGIDYSRSAVTNSAGTVTMNWNSLALKNFDLTTTETGNITLSFTNTSNLVQGRLTLRVTGTITVTMPSGVVMDIFEEDIGRWNSSTNVLTLTGITASPFLLDFYSDGTNIWCHASNRGL